MNKYLEQFFTRNSKYIKHQDVSKELISKYTGILPEPILEVWRRMGLGIYEHGFIQFVNPDEWGFAIDYLINLPYRTTILGITALGDLLVWVDQSPTVSVDIIFVNNGESKVLSGSDINFWLGYGLDTKQDTPEHEDFEYFLDEFRAQNYHKVKGLLPPLKYGQCYGYVPLPALGGKKSYKSLQVVDAKIYVDMIGQAVGKIIDLSE